MKEVELKIYIGKEVGDMQEKLSSFGAPTDSEQTDVYYTNAHKDFIKTEECLRIRSTPKKDEITWKPPTTVDMWEMKQYWKEEKNIDITGKVAEFRYLLSRLDFIEYVIVQKRRLEYKVDASTTIALDIIDGAGVFLEVETMGEDAEEATKNNEKILNELDIKNFTRVNRPYRDIVKDGNINV